MNAPRPPSSLAALAIDAFGVESVNPRTIRPPRGPTAVTPPSPALDTSELRDLLDDAKQGLDRRNGGAGLRSGGKIAGQPCEACEGKGHRVLTMAEVRAGKAKRSKRGQMHSDCPDCVGSGRANAGSCYTCELLDREATGPHEHPFEDLVAAEIAERGLWQLVNRARPAGKTPAPKPISGSRRW